MTSPRIPLLLLLADPAQQSALQDSLAAIAPELVPLAWRRDCPDSALAEIEFVLGWRLPVGLIQRMPALRWICATGAGVDKLLLPDLPAPVQVSRVVDPDQAAGMAQYVALMVLRHARGLVAYEAHQRSRQWRRQPLVAARQQVLVLGRGEVGTAVGGALRALGFEVRHWHSQSGALPPALATAEVVVNTLPLTDATAGLLDAPAFAAMPRGAYLVNVARGGHVVEADLIAATRSGWLAGAALDVQQHEPLPPDDPLWDVPGITITPHIAAQPSWQTVAQQFVAGLRCVQRGEPPPHAVDRRRGY